MDNKFYCKGDFLSQNDKLLKFSFGYADTSIPNMGHFDHENRFWNKKFCPAYPVKNNTAHKYNGVCTMFIFYLATMYELFRCELSKLVVRVGIPNIEGRAIFKMTCRTI